MRVTTAGKCEQKSSQKSLATMIQGFSGQAISALSAITSQIAQSVQQGKALLESSAQVIHTNLRIFQIVHNIHLFILQLPGQIQRQQPVYFTDPYNKESPFHLEFVRSPEALLAILKINLKESGCGPAMIDRGEFAIEELGTRRKVDLAAPWDICFFPGQKVAMSMVFKEPLKDAKSSCPSCGTIQQEAAEQEITCIVCGSIFRRIEEMFEIVSEMSESDPKDKSKVQVRGPARPPKNKAREEDSMSINMRKFRRIQLINQIFYSKPLKCSLIDCEEAFDDQEGLQDHKLHAHKNIFDQSSSLDDQGSTPPRRCHSCNRTDTRKWRRGPDGEGTLCNTCGLHYLELTRKLGGTPTVINSSDRRPNSPIQGPTTETDSEFTAESESEGKSITGSDVDLYEPSKHDDIEILEYSSEEERERIGGETAVTSNLRLKSIEEASGLTTRVTPTTDVSTLEKFSALSILEDSSDEEEQARIAHMRKRTPEIFKTLVETNKSLYGTYKSLFGTNKRLAGMNKRDLNQSIESDSSYSDNDPLDDIDPTARRLRRRVRGPGDHRASMVFEDRGLANFNKVT
ncbi:unnamed protein product [Periconia digitata]|uniref:GATA-type domain-containing protein n=1 Tax=Periconia digitata TaxID=1303443 RepID=A0A9W4U241_9PLEO|nr:unnamed protein product [Periconia digitata]